MQSKNKNTIYLITGPQKAIKVPIDDLHAFNEGEVSLADEDAYFASIKRQAWLRFSAMLSLIAVVGALIFLMMISLADAFSKFLSDYITKIN